VSESIYGIPYKLTLRNTEKIFVQHQQQVAVAVERAKQITMAELNAVMQVPVTTSIYGITVLGGIWIRLDPY
jgi:hypothetical protein